METQYKAKIYCFIVINLIILIVLYIIPTDMKILNNICLSKIIIGRPCWNCGMTRAFLSILHLYFDGAYNYNHNVIIVFPMTVGIYLYSWIKYINGGKKYE